MLKIFSLAVAMTLAGCALVKPQQAASVAPAARAAPPLQPVSLNAAPRLRASQPMGLAPCAPGVFGATNCWRKSDRHYVFEDPVPEGLASSPLTAPPATLVRN